MTECGLKSAMRPYLDDDILYRTKQGFTPPVVHWLRGPLREMAGDILLDPHASWREYLNGEVVERAWREHQSKIRNYTPLLWALLMFELWVRKFIHQSPGEQVAI